MAKRFSSLGAPVIKVRVFGKHPAWLDFVDGPRGSEDPCLLALENNFVLGALSILWRPNDNGTWDERLIQPGRLKEIHLAEQRGSRFVLAVIVPSQDKTGNATRKIPLAIAAVFSGCEMPQAERACLNLLSEGARKIRAADTQDAFRAAFRETERALKESVATLVPENEDQASIGLELPEGDLDRLLAAVAANLGSYSIDPRRDPNESRTSKVIRLPVETIRGAASLSRWMLFFRTQISDQAPILGFQRAEESWCDLVVGPTTEETICSVARGQEEFPILSIQPASEIPSSLSPETFSKAREGLNRPWRDPGKTTVFGAAPRNFVPQLPGKVKLFERIVGRFGEFRLHTGGIVKPALAAGLAALAVGLAIYNWQKPAAKSESTPPKQSLTQAKTIPEARRPGEPNVDDVTLASWFSYVNDYDHWLWAFDKTNRMALDSTNLAAALEQTLRTNNIDTLEPLALVGSRDPDSRFAPSRANLRDRATQVRAAFKARSELRFLVAEGYPGRLLETLSKVTNIIFAGAISNAQSAVNSQAQGMAAIVRGSTNEPNRNAQRHTSIATNLSRLATLENSVKKAVEEVAKWNKIKGWLGDFDPTLTRLALSAETNWVSMTNLIQLAGRVSGTNQAADNVFRWAESNWKDKIDREAVKNALAAADLKTFEDWERTARDYIFLPQDKDPRPTLLKRLNSSELRQQVDQVSVALKNGFRGPTNAASLGPRLERLIEDGQQLAGIRSLQGELQSITNSAKRIEVALKNFEADLAFAWATMFDLGKLIAEQRKKRLSEPMLNVLWSAYLGGIEKASDGIRKKSGEAPRIIEESSRFWTNLQAFNDHQFWPIEKQLSTPQLADIQSPLRGLYVQKLLPQIIDTNTFALRADAAKILNDPDKKKIDADLVNAIEGFGRFERAAQQADSVLPETSTELQSAAKKLLASEKTFPAFYSIDRVKKLYAFAQMAAGSDRPWSAAEWVNAARNENRPEALALLSAKINSDNYEVKTTNDWGFISLIAARLIETRQGKNLAGVTNWLGNVWKKRPSTLSLKEMVTWGDVASESKLAPLYWPATLVANWSLGKLAAAIIDNDPNKIHQAHTNLTAVSSRILTNRLSADALTLLTTSPSLMGGTDWARLGPVAAGARVSSKDMTTAVLTADEAALNFRLLEPPGTPPVFVSISEISCADLLKISASTNRWPWVFNRFTEEATNTAAHHGLTKPPPGKKAEFFRQAPFALLNIVPVVPNAGEIKEYIVRTNSVASLPPELAKIDGNFPANYISPLRAADIATSIGCRLLSTEEWRKIDQIASPTASNYLDSQSSGAITTVLETLRLRSEEHVFHIRRSKSSKNISERVNFFSPVDDPAFVSAIGLFHWRGNVAEILQNGANYWIAGGSFVSEPGVSEMHPVKVEDGRQTFADVGLRLAFDWIGERPQEKLQRTAASLEPVNLE